MHKWKLLKTDERDPPKGEEEVETGKRSLQNIIFNIINNGKGNWDGEEEEKKQRDNLKT